MGGLLWVSFRENCTTQLFILNYFFKLSVFPFIYLCLKNFFPESLLSTALVCVYTNKQNLYFCLFIKERKDDKVIIKDIRLHKQKMNFI